MRDYRARHADEVMQLQWMGGPFRFAIGERVESNVGTWASGKVVAHYYREDHWPPEEWTPYQVQLDDGQLIYAPSDVDDCIRAKR